MHPMTSAGLTLAFLATLAPLHARAATPAEEIAALRAEIDALRQSYEARLQALDARLRAAEAAAATPAASAPAPARVTAQPAAPGVAPETPQPGLPAAASSTAQPAAPAAAGAGSGNAFNPALSLILSGLATHTSQDPARYQITGFALPPGRLTYVHVARGRLRVNGELLEGGDAAKLRGEDRLVLEGGEQAEVLVFDLQP